MPLNVRFAPSPTGLLHIGNARTALFNWLLALKEGGRFILRFDDTDAERSRPEFADAIAEDLAWLGIRPHQVERQSARLGRYRAAMDDLIGRGLLYPCYETADELDLKRRRQRLRNQPPVYDRAALTLEPAERARLEAEGRRPHWRFLLPNHDGDPLQIGHRSIVFDDLSRGRQSIDLGSLSDPVLVREDGSFLYTLPSVVDDIDLGVTHVVRGEDHITNTGVQIALFEALGAAPPAFGHHNLLTDASGEGLSKRKGSLSLRSLREAGYEPQAVAALAVLTGTAAAVRAVADLAELAPGFDLAAVSKSSARFDPADLEALNADTLRALPFAAVAERMVALGVPADPEVWALFSGNLARFDDLAGWWHVVTGEAPRIIAVDDAPLLAIAAKLLPAFPFDQAAFKAWTAAVGAETGRKGKALFLPLRLALTGREHGPELAGLMRLIGREDTLARLSAPVG
ncbi:glutamate--tRNA ligase [Methylobrevis albus]|uniref:Glutamate--tRNA ligase n=1 Tax=Methylobrevis albus TaxID=2793297 RepID=A0A931I4B3_9HYPH|nr:glutamate--tRNA ligase [Methylobrevis albus]MBH0238996.1 glutamate--tRNA ligase [Methylobrevis albus]